MSGEGDKSRPMNQLWSRRSKKLSLTNSRWAAYATAGAATAISGINTAEAVIHYSGPINQSFNAPPGSSTGATFALAPGASFVPVHLATSSGAEGIALIGFRGAVSAAFNGVTGGYAYVSRLGAGENPTAHPFINSAGGFVPGYGTLAFRGGYGGDQWLAAGEGYVGFRFDTGSGVQYGWVHLNMNGSPLNSFSLVDFAWADPGENIVTGQIPEPGSIALLALGAVGLVVWRKQRAKAA
jgi:PEP-CTERM motif